MIRRNLFLAATFAVVLALILFVNVPARSASAANAPADDAMTSRLEAVAGAGMIGGHTFNYLTQLSDEVGPRVTGSPEAARAVQWGVDTMKAMGLENVHAEHYQLWKGWTRGVTDAGLVAPRRREGRVEARGGVGCDWRAGRRQSAGNSFNAHRNFGIYDLLRYSGGEHVQRRSESA
jgi:carboxypeptidase Q